MDVVFLVYGLSFLGLSLAIVIRNDHHSGLALSHQLWLLAAFGLSHGLVEWCDLWNFLHKNIPVYPLLQTGLLLISYLCLFEFGRRLMLVSLSIEAQAKLAARILGTWIYLPILLAVLAGTLTSEQPVQALNIWSRYLPGFLGSCLTGIAMYWYCHERLVVDGSSWPELPRVRLACRMAPIAFIAYGVFGGLIVARSDVLFSATLNTDSFSRFFLVPIQLPRAITAFLIAYSVTTLLEVFSRESQLRLQQALIVSDCSLTELKRVNRRNQSILDQITEGVIGLDTSGNVNVINDAALAMLGIQSSEILQKPFHGFLNSTTVSTKSQLPSAQKEEEISSTDQQLFMHDGKTVTAIRCTTTPLWDGNQITGSLVLLRTSDRR